jgi:hypothetical protein
MSRRAWCQATGPPRSREAFQSNPPATNRGVILKFYLMNFAAFAECGRAGHACGCNAMGRSCPNRVSGESIASPTVGLGPMPSGETGRVTLAGVGSFPVATPRNRRLTTSGVPLIQTRTVKSSTMRGARALASKRQQRRCQTGKARSGWIRGRFCILPSEISSPWNWKLCRGGSPGHTW